MYVTLEAWNMNSRGAQLSDFDKFKKSITDNKTLLSDLEEYNIRDINYAFDKLETLYNNLDLVKTKSKLVTFTKTLQFILPELVVPIDRKYTLNFYSINPNRLDQGPFGIFKSIHSDFCNFINTADYNREILSRRIIKTPDELTWLTSETKIIDNIIIGYQLKANTK